MVTGQPKRNRDDLNQRASKGAYQRVHADNRQWQAGTFRPRHQNYGQYSPSDPDVADLDLDSQIQQLQATLSARSVWSFATHTLTHSTWGIVSQTLGAVCTGAKVSEAKRQHAI